MHSALCVNEIVAMVTHLVDNDDLSSASDLVSMGVACRVFYGPAMDRLWRDMDGLVPLLRCLPSDAVDVRAIEGKDSAGEPFGIAKLLSYLTTSTGRGALGPEDWYRFQIYAARVHVLRMDFGGGSQSSLDLKILTLIRKSYSGTSAFPNIEMLHVTGYSPSIHDLDHLDLFTQESLHSISLAPPYRRNIDPASRPTKVRGDRAWLIADRLLTRFPGLKSLEFCGIVFPHTLYLKLCSEPVLQHLRIGLDTSSESLAVTERATRVPSSIKSLQLDIMAPPDVSPDSVPDIPAALNRIRPGTLEKLKILLTVPPNFFLLPLTTAIASFHETLGTLVLDYSWPGGLPMNYAALVPLTSLRNIHTLDLRVPIILKHSELIRLLPSWPGLTHLVLGDWNGLGTNDFHLGTIEEIASFCPRLRHLGIYLAETLGTADSDDEGSSDAYAGLPQHAGLEELDLLDTQFQSNMKGPAVFFRQVFPNATVMREGGLVDM